MFNVLNVQNLNTLSAIKRHIGLVFASPNEFRKMAGILPAPGGMILHWLVCFGELQIGGNNMASAYTSNTPSVAVVGSGYWGKNLVRNF